MPHALEKYTMYKREKLLIMVTNRINERGLERLPKWAPVPAEDDPVSNYWLD